MAIMKLEAVGVGRDKGEDEKQLIKFAWPNVEHCSQIEQKLLNKYQTVQ